MINKKFRDNWVKMLDYNANVDLGDKFKLTEEKIRIPLTPIEINPYLLYYLFETLYPKFINSQQNILDIVISDNEKTILKLYFYKTKKAGIHESLKKLPSDTIKLHRKDFEEMDKLYNRIIEKLNKKNIGRVPSIRILKEQAINAINDYCLNLEDIPLDTLFIRFLDLVQKLIGQDLFIIYPEPKIFKFFKEIINFLNGHKFSNFFKILFSILPEFNISFIISSTEQKIILHLQKILISKSEKPYLRLKLLFLEDLGINIEGLREKRIIELVNNQLKTDRSYFLYQNDILSLLTDISNLPINIKKENMLLLLQKILFGYRSYETHWLTKPKPTIYNNFLRFLLRLIGFNVNLRKLSHWGISEFLSTLFDSWFGLNFKILLILTDIRKSKKLNLKNFKYLEAVTDYILLFEIENKALTNIISIDKENLFNKQELGNLESIRNRISQEHGYLSGITIIDKQLIQNLVKEFIFNHFKYSPRSKLRTLKKLRKQEFFYLFPELPIYRILRKKGSISLLKLILPIMIDKHEF
ncbi:MAG: hypothetical protein ACFFA3_09490 [Promethearchaeota archaeon]